MTDFIIWALRFINYFQEIKVIGQTFRMIRAILVVNATYRYFLNNQIKPNFTFLLFKQKDIIFFLIVIIILFTTAGMVFHCLSEEIKVEDNYTESIKMIFHHAFWPIFGITDSINSIIRSNSTNFSQEKYKYVYSYTVSTFYMVAILILINILIAMFK